MIESLSASAVYPNILSDMKEYTYTIATLPFFPFVWKTGENYLGIDIDMIKYLSNRYNFRQAYELIRFLLTKNADRYLSRYKLINPQDGAWGKPDENGTWSGLVGHALYGKANWSASGIGVTPEVKL